MANAMANPTTGNNAMSVWNNAVPGPGEQFVRKREALLRAAAQSFNRRGYHGTSLTDIAKKLGVTKAALYTYVPSKEELLYYCHDSAMDAAFEALEQGRTRGRNGLEKLTLTLMGYLELMLSQEASFVLLMEEHAMRPAHVKAIIRRRDQFERGLRDLIADGIKDGSIAPCNPKLAAFVALGALNWVRKWYAPGGTWSGYQTAFALTEMIERALSSRPAKSLTEDPSELPAEALPDVAPPKAKAGRRPA
jgi:TetR/AcrR family transcriptional regulator